MIIGISGKIGSGKDTVGKMIQHQSKFHLPHQFYPVEEAIQKIQNNTFNGDNFCDWKTKKFADALKDMVCLLLGCTRKQLEDQEFKNTPLGEEWTRYGYADGFDKRYRNGKEETVMNNVPCSKERYEEELRINWPTAYKLEHTPRTILQLLDTECGRNIIHPNIWVNALFKDYYPYPIKNSHISVSNWIITDVRFPNEADAIKEKGGLVIRVEREDRTEQHKVNVHTSETALDDYTSFDATINNYGTLEELYENVKWFLEQCRKNKYDV